MKKILSIMLLATMASFYGCGSQTKAEIGSVTATIQTDSFDNNLGVYVAKVLFTSTYKDECSSTISNLVTTANCDITYGITTPNNFLLNTTNKTVVAVIKMEVEDEGCIPTFISIKGTNLVANVTENHTYPFETTLAIDNNATTKII